MKTIVSLSQLSSQNAEMMQGETFIHQISTGEKISYSRLDETSRRLATWLRSNELKTGSRVVLIARNHWLFFPLLIACAIEECILVPVDPSLHQDELKSILTHSDPSLIIFDSDRPAQVAIPKALVFSLAETLALIQAEPPSAAPSEIPSKGKAKGLLLIYTSGTTGGAKAVLLSEENLIANAQSLRDFYAIGRSDRFYCFLPTFHMNAIMITGLLPFVSQAQIHLSDVFGFKNAKFFWDELSKHGITVCSLVPSIMSMLLRLFKDGAKVTSTLRHGFCGAAPLPAELWKQFESVFGFPIYQGYGLTETTCWAAATPPEARRYDTVGKPINCEFQIDPSRADDSAAVEADRRTKNGNEPFTPDRRVTLPGPVGEIMIRGPIVMSEYFRNRQLTKTHITREGFYRTGDLGFIDHDGFVHVTGRIKEIIIRNGVNVSGRDIDDLLSQNELVQECKTIGIPDPLVGERVHTVCVKKSNTTASPEALLGWLRERLSEYKRPDQLTLMGYLPRTSTGKVSPHIIRKIVNGELCEEIIHSLNSWKKKRAHPSDLDSIKSGIQRALIDGTPIKFLSYWGCGTRSSIHAIDKIALDRISDFVLSAARISEAPARLALILTDLHAANNGIPVSRSEKYLSEITEYASALGIECIKLSSMWKKKEISPNSLTTAASSPEFLNTWEKLEIREKLIAQAKKHLEGSDQYETAARRYYRACCWDNEVLTELFKEHIFLTYNPPEMDVLLPNLPKMYLYSTKEGNSEKPWFMDEEKDDRDAAA